MNTYGYTNTGGGFYYSSGPRRRRNTKPKRTRQQGLPRDVGPDWIHFRDQLPSEGQLVEVNKKGPGPTYVGKYLGPTAEGTLFVDNLCVQDPHSEVTHILGWAWWRPAEGAAS